MFRFFQQLGYCNCCIPITGITLTAEDRQVFVTSGQERLDSNTVTHESHRFRNGTKHSKLASISVPPQDSSGNPVSRSLPSNSRAIEQNISTTVQDAYHSGYTENTRIVPVDQQNVNNQETEDIDSEIRSDRSTTEVAEQGPVTMFQNAQHLNFSGNARIMNIGHQHVNSHVNYSLNNLKEFVSFSALHDSSAQDPERCCHPGTRKSVLGQIRDWADNPSKQEGILWLHGPAGVGKSAIAQTIANSYERDKLGATFFFFRSDPIRNDGNRLFPTLTWQLAFSVPTVKDLIAFSLEEYPDIPRKAIEVQFDKLINQPFLTIPGGESTTSTSTRVIVIDGLDECSDIKLQERILKIIGKAVTDTRFPLHFLISSRPEPHIQDFFNQFRHPVLRIDLANVNDAFRDIETYLRSEFACIAIEQQLDAKTWPAQGIIDTLVSRSSAQFVYASTVMKYIGDKYESAVAQLDVILGLKSSSGKSPFSELDALYTEILQRQPDQKFLKEFLPLFVARSTLSNVDEHLHEDDAMLLGLDVTQLHRKLRGLHSVLKFEPFIDAHHKSFPDFLHDLSRSGEYHVSKHFAHRRYMQRITDLLVKAASSAMEQSDFHEDNHFIPRFANVTKSCPLKIELPLNDLEEILRPLHIIQENLLELPNMSVPWKPRACGECWTFYMIDDLLLHLAWFRGTIQLQEPKYIGICPLTTTEEKESTPQLDLDACLSLLLHGLRCVASQLPVNVDMIGLMRTLVRFDPIETAMKIRSITDAQNLVELIFCLNKNKCFKSWFGAAAHNATRLAVAIYGRVPLLPRSLFLNSADLDRGKSTYQGNAVVIWNIPVPVGRKCLGAFMWGCLSHGSMGPFLGISSIQSDVVEILASPENASAMRKWRQSNNPSVSTIQQIFFEVAKAIQYIHSLGIVFGYRFDETNICVDSDCYAKVLCPGFCPNDLCKGQFDYEGYSRSNSSLETNIRWFAVLFYRVLFNKWEYNPVTYKTRPSGPEIPDNVWQLMQWCCAQDPNERPTIDQVVQEMESWISLGQFTLSSRYIEP